VGQYLGLQGVAVFQVGQDQVRLAQALVALVGRLML